MFYRIFSSFYWNIPYRCCRYRCIHAAQMETENEGEVESETDSSPTIPQRQRPRSSSRTHRQHPADLSGTASGALTAQQRGRAAERTVSRPTIAPRGGGGGGDGTCRTRSRLRLTESQILEKLSSIVSDGRPCEKYATLERIGHGWVCSFIDAYSGNDPPFCVLFCHVYATL